MRHRWTKAATFAGLLGSIAPVCRAATPVDGLDTGQTAWIITASALVLFMTLPGLALFYGGLVRARNLLSILMHSFSICCVVSLIWALAGYSLVFDGTAPYLGGFRAIFLEHLAPIKAGTGMPENVFALFQMTFAIITPTLIIGAFPERVKFSFVVLFSAIWMVVVYLPVAHWVWGGGWLAKIGVLDFAGGIVVHTTAGVSALVAALLIGARHGFPHSLTPPHNPGITMAGAGMLWVGWFGFNGGSALAADGTAGSAILCTHLAASAAAVTWIVIERIRIGKATSIGIVTGAVAGLATITPASGYVGPAGAMVIGAAGGAVCFFATLLIKHRLRVDDSLDVFAVHGVGGMLGSVLLAGFALPALGGSGLAEGMNFTGQLAVQALAVGVTGLWSGAATFIIVKAIGAVSGLRVSREEEYDGLDLSMHGERAYDFN
ncbi:MAG TPA: ammonium transporter [Alphaproteobacteria bacterium]|jgi:Amt family ammonium transporter|nr:ammonium transporter [Alphaproteobacteria bacterium]